jgi:hypothetical protein
MAQCKNVGAKITLLHKKISSKTTSIEYVGIWKEISAILDTMLANLGIDEHNFLNKEMLRNQVEVAKSRNQPISDAELNDLSQQITFESDALTNLLATVAPAPADILAQQTVIATLQVQFETQRRVWTFHKALNVKLKTVKEIQDALVNGLIMHFPELPGSLNQMLPRSAPASLVNILTSRTDALIPVVGVAGNDLTEAELLLFQVEVAPINFIMLPFNDSFCKYEQLIERISKHYIQASDQEQATARIDLVNPRNKDYRFDDSRETFCRGGIKFFSSLILMKELMILSPNGRK